MRDNALYLSVGGTIVEKCCISFDIPLQLPGSFLSLADRSHFERYQVVRYVQHAIVVICVWNLEESLQVVAEEYC